MITAQFDLRQGDRTFDTWSRAIAVAVSRASREGVRQRVFSHTGLHGCPSLDRGRRRCVLSGTWHVQAVR